MKQRAYHLYYFTLGTMQVDKDAANRFIKAAITETKKGRNQDG
jgi:hypothetical protein